MTNTDLVSSPALQDPTRVAREALSDRLAAAGVSSRHVSAISETPRHEFLPREFWRLAYVDAPATTYAGPLLSPSATAALVEAAAVRPFEVVVEFGTFTGWLTVVLARLAHQVTTFDAVPAPSAQDALARFVGEDVSTRTLHDLATTPLSLCPVAVADVVVFGFALAELPSGLLRRLRVGARMVIALGHDDPHLYVLRARADGLAVEARGAIALDRALPLEGVLLQAGLGA